MPILRHYGPYFLRTLLNEKASLKKEGQWYLLPLEVSSLSEQLRLSLGTASRLKKLFKN